jgi:hypothetical protein
MLTCTGYVTSNCRMILNSDFERNWSWPMLKFFPRFSSGQGTTTETSVSVDGLWADLETQWLRKKKRKTATFVLWFGLISVSKQKCSEACRHNEFIECPVWGNAIRYFHVSHAPPDGSGPLKFSMQWVPSYSGRSAKHIIHLYLMPVFRMSGAILSLPCIFYVVILKHLKLETLLNNI